MVLWRALLFGPEFTRLLHATALRKGPGEWRAVVAGELILSAAWIAFVFGVSGSRVL
jgi:hypothetical protein